MRVRDVILITLFFIAVLAHADETRVSLGADLTLGSVNYTVNSVAGNYDGNIMLVGGHVFLDARYLVASIGISPLLSANVGLNSVGFPAVTNQHGTILDFSLAGKYPIEFVRGLVVFPIFGIEFDAFLMSDNYANLSPVQIRELNDFYMVFGVGADIDLTRDIYLRLSGDYGYNLSANPAVKLNDTIYTGYKVKGSIGIGFRL